MKQVFHAAMLVLAVACTVAVALNFQPGGPGWDSDTQLLLGMACCFIALVALTRD